MDGRSVEYTSEVSTPEDKYEMGATAQLLDEHSRLKYACEITESHENEKIPGSWRGTEWVRNMITRHIKKVLKRKFSAS